MRNMIYRNFIKSYGEIALLSLSSSPTKLLSTSLILTLLSPTTRRACLENKCLWLSEL